MAEIKPRYLVMVTASANNNKYYKQIPHGDSWTAEYGRVGSSPQRREYSMSQWESKYKEKLRKGYVDQSELVEDLIQVEKPKNSEYKEIENKVIAEIVERLQAMARKAISDNYTISSNKVTQASIIWIVIGIALLLGGRYLFLKRKCIDNIFYDFYVIVIATIIMMFFIGGLMIIMQIFDIATCITFPEKIILHELQNIYRLYK